MIKNLSVFLTILVSFIGLGLGATAAQATLSIGAQARYQGAIYDVNGTSLGPFSGLIELLSIDSAASSVTTRKTFQFPGSPESVQESTDTIEMAADEATLQAILSQCVNIPGGAVPETITVPAGTFSACKVPVDNADSKGFVWIGVVPFSSLRSDVILKASGQRWLTELSAFHF